jgi:hypothetical protein
VYRKTIILLLSLFTGSVLTIGGLYLYSLKGKNLKNGFLRLYPAHVLGKIIHRSLPNETLYIVGVASDKIFLGDYKNIQSLYQTDSNLSFFHTIPLGLPFLDEFLTSQSRIMFESDQLYVIQQLTSTIYKTTLSTTPSIQTFMDSPNISSTAAVPLSSTSFILRTYYDPLKQNILTKRTLHKPYFQYATGTLQKQVDGIFCTDGALLLNKESKQVIYVYTYRNQFICLDSNLKVLYRARTIDTNTIAKIQVVEIKSQSQSTLSNPPITVNRLSYVSGNHLFINSALSADNEVVSNFNRYAVIDVYNSNDGSYQFSFYVARDHERPISSFMVWGNKLILIQGATLFIYDIDKAFIH